ncbi:MAG: hypothetical protein HY510_03800 [Acidobacteria bacterium]|nr:hypothetical protein [Acidobacteriota bacterium]
MSEHILDTPSVARSYCPGCEPTADSVKEILDVRWCDAHHPEVDGAEDEKLIANAYLSGSAEAGGDPNRAVCDFVHRKKKP